MPSTRSATRKAVQTATLTPKKVEKTQKIKIPEKKLTPRVDNFPEHLKRNNRIYTIPVTSTPKPAKESLAITKKDVDTCFGFDDENEENYDCLISPIQTAKKNAGMITYKRGNDGAGSFNALLAKYKKPEPDDGLEVHFDPGAPIKTYTHKKFEPYQDFHPEAFAREGKSKTTGRKKTSRKTKNSDVLDEKTQKWLDEKNKEFEDLLHVPLVVTKGK